jgi:hypothetical protein
MQGMGAAPPVAVDTEDAEAAVVMAWLHPRGSINRVVSQSDARPASMTSPSAPLALKRRGGSSSNAGTRANMAKEARRGRINGRTGPAISGRCRAGCDEPSHTGELAAD